MASQGVDGLEGNKLGGQVLDTWWDPAMGVRLLSLMAGYPGRLKFGLVKHEADESLLSAEVVHPCLRLAWPKGVKVMEGGNGSVTSLEEPVGLRKLSNMLELMGRVVSTTLESSMQRFFPLHLADPAAGEGEWLCLRELWAFGDFSWSSKVGSLGQEDFLVDVESGRFGVEVLELHPEPHWGPLLLLEHLALGDSAGVSKAAALCGDCLVTTGSLTCW